MANLRARARRDTQLKYGQAMSALAQLLQEAGASYRTDVSNTRAAADATVQAAQAARPDVVSAYLSAGKIGDAAMQDSAPVLQGINPQGAAAPVLAAIGREREQRGSALGSAMADALQGLTDRQQQARAGEIAGVRAAGQTRAAATSKIRQSITDTSKEAGTYAVSRLDEYRDTRRQANLTRRGQDKSLAGTKFSAREATRRQKAENRQQTRENAKDRAAARDNALINQGLDPATGKRDPKTGKVTYKPLPKGKGSKPKMLTTNESVKVVGRVRSAAEQMKTLLGKPGADRAEVLAGLRAGYVDGTRYSQPELDVAVDLFENGGKLSPKGARVLRNQLRVPVPGYFEKKREPKWFENGVLPTLEGMRLKTVPGG